MRNRGRFARFFDHMGNLFVVIFEFGEDILEIIFESLGD